MPSGKSIYTRTSRYNMISCSYEYSGPSHPTKNPCLKDPCQLTTSPKLRNMHISSLAYLLPLAALVVSQDTSIDTVKRAFTAANVRITLQVLERRAQSLSTQIPRDLGIKFNPTALLEVSLPQATGAPIALHAGIQVPRDCMSTSYLSEDILTVSSQ